MPWRDNGRKGVFEDNCVLSFAVYQNVCEVEYAVVNFAISVCFCEVVLIQNFDGKEPMLDATAWVHEGAWVIGDVTLGAEVSIWPTAVLRGDMKRIRIGAYTNIQDGSVVHTTDTICDTVVGERVTVGHRAILHSCTVEDDCLIGMGAIVMDGAVVGKGSIVGAGALVTPRTQIPPGSLVLGSPAKVARATTERDRQWVEYSWKIYAEKASIWRAM